MPSKKPHLTLYFPDPVLYRRLRILAQKESCNPAKYAVRILQYYLQNRSDLDDEEEITWAQEQDARKSLGLPPLSTKKPPGRL
jgi:hypothetical protein